MHLGKEDLFQEERSKLNHLPPSSFLSILLQTTLAGSVDFVRCLPKVLNDVRSQMHLHQELPCRRYSMHLNPGPLGKSHARIAGRESRCACNRRRIVDRCVPDLSNDVKCFDHN